MLGPLAFAQGLDPGISLELARQHGTQIADLRYRLELELAPGAGRMPGREEIRFRLASAQPVVLAYRLGNLRSVAANGRPVRDLAQHNGHIRIPGSYFRSEGSFQSGGDGAGDLDGDLERHRRRECDGETPRVPAHDVRREPADEHLPVRVGRRSRSC